MSAIGAGLFGSPRVAFSPEDFLGKVVGNGQCAALVKEAADAPATSAWAAGDPVRGNAGVAPGTAIATFQNGKYWNKSNGESHAAIYVSQDAGGLYVIDQWRGQPTHARYIRFRGGVPNADPSPGSVAPHNDGDAYSVVIAGYLPVVGGWADRVGEVLPSNDGASQAEILARMRQASKPASFWSKKTGPLTNQEWCIAGGSVFVLGILIGWIRS